MSNKGDTAAGIQNKLVTQTAKLIEQARKFEEDCDCYKAGFALGTILHFLQDSYTLSHASRESLGRITMFQAFLLQSPTLHAREDVLKQHGDAFRLQVERSRQLLEVFETPDLTGDALINFLREEFYKLAPGAEVGETETWYAPR